MNKQKRKKEKELSNESKYKIHLVNEATNLLECKPFKQLVFLFMKYSDKELSKQEVAEKLKWSNEQAEEYLNKGIKHGFIIPVKDKEGYYILNWANPHLTFFRTLIEWSLGLTPKVFRE
jgi:hypothetical protein